MHGKSKLFSRYSQVIFPFKMSLLLGDILLSDLWMFAEQCWLLVYWILAYLEKGMY